MEIVRRVLIVRGDIERHDGLEEGFTRLVRTEQRVSIHIIPKDDDEEEGGGGRRRRGEEGGGGGDEDKYTIISICPPPLQLALLGVRASSSPP